MMDGWRDAGDWFCVPGRLPGVAVPRTTPKDRQNRERKRSVEASGDGRGANFWDRAPIWKLVGAVGAIGAVLAVMVLAVIAPMLWDRDWLGRGTLLLGGIATFALIGFGSDFLAKRG